MPFVFALIVASDTILKRGEQERDLPLLKSPTFLLLALPAESGIGFVTGATMANLSGLAAARHAVLKGTGWDVEAQGLFGAPPITVLVGDEVHVSLLKALSLLGLGRERVVRVPVDGQGRMRPEALPALEEIGRAHV